MKHWLFTYREDREALCDPDYGYTHRLVITEKSFPADTMDDEVLDVARHHEVKELLQDRGTASEGILHRTLLQVIQVAREIDVRVTTR